MKKLIKFVFYLLFFPFKKIIPKSNIILFGTYSRHIYRENTCYLFEYMSKKNSYQCYWITDNNLIKRYLKKKKFKFISTSSPFHMIWVLLRTRIIIDSGTGYFNPFKILDNGKTIKITTLHGNGPKANFSPNGKKTQDAIKQIKRHLEFDYVNYPSDYSIETVGKKSHQLPSDKLVNLGYPRCDQYFNKDYVESRYKNRSFIKSIFNEFKNDSKIIFYTPTWRPYKFSFPLFEMTGFNEKSFNSWLYKNDIYFIYSVHTARLPNNMLEDTSRVINLDMNKNPFIDINEIMLEVDILLNDYSTTSTEFAILNRPQVFLMPDFKKYSYEKGFIEDYREIMPGKEIITFMDFINVIIEITSDTKKYLEKYENNRKNLVNKYYDLKDGSSAEKFFNFIKNLMS